jgi:hypothetical protein
MGLMTRTEVDTMNTESKMIAARRLLDEIRGYCNLAEDAVAGIVAGAYVDDPATGVDEVADVIAGLVVDILATWDEAKEAYGF